MNLLEWTDREGERDPLEAVFPKTCGEMAFRDPACDAQARILGRWRGRAARFLFHSDPDGHPGGWLGLE